MGLRFILFDFKVNFFRFFLVCFYLVIVKNLVVIKFLVGIFVYGEVVLRGVFREVEVFGKVFCDRRLLFYRVVIFFLGEDGRLFLEVRWFV